MTAPALVCWLDRFPPFHDRAVKAGAGVSGMPIAELPWAAGFLTDTVLRHESVIRLGRDEKK